MKSGNFLISQISFMGFIGGGWLPKVRLCKQMNQCCFQFHMLCLRSVRDPDQRWLFHFFFPYRVSFFPQIGQVKQELSRKDTELLALQTKLETLTNQFSDSKQHIEVLKESLTAKEQRAAILQTEVKMVLGSAGSWLLSTFSCGLPVLFLLCLDLGDKNNLIKFFGNVIRYYSKIEPSCFWI